MANKKIVLVTSKKKSDVSNTSKKDLTKPKTFAEQRAMPVSYVFRSLYFNPK